MEGEMKQRTLSLLVDNTAGVMSRVAGLFSRRAFNIDSLSVGVTMDPRYSRITIVASGDDQALDQIIKQVRKREEVRNVKVLEPGNSVQRELMLVKVRATEEERDRVISLARIFHSKIVDVSRHSITCEVKGPMTKLDAFLELLEDYEVLELARTGVTGLSRGSGDVTFL